MTKYIRLAAFSAGLLLGTATAVVYAATPADTLVIAKNIDDIISLDPAEVFEITGGELINNLYTRLVTHDTKDFTKLVGGVAESWVVSEVGSTITFKIRKGQTFASGNPVTAQDAAYSLQRVVALNKTPAFILTQFGWTPENVKELVKAVDDETLAVTLKQKFAPTLVLNALSAGVGSVVDSKLVQSKESNGDWGYEWLKTSSAGSGAYSLLEWKPKEAVALQASKTYYLGAPALDQVVVRHVPEAATQRLLLEKGDVDIARNLQPDQIDALSATGNFTVSSEPKQTVIYLGLNTKKAEFANPKVREAVRWLVDYDGLASSVLKGQYKVHQAFLGEGIYGALNDNPFKLDAEKAKAALKEAGVEGGFNLNLDIPNSPPFLDIGQSIQATFKQAGVNVELVQSDQKQVLTKYRARNHDAVLIYWSPDYLDPHSTADYFARNPDNSDGASAKTLPWRNTWDIPELTKQADAAALEADTEKRALAYRDLQATLQKDSPLAVLFQQVEVSVLGKNVSGFISGPTFDTVTYAGVKKQ